MQSAPADRPDNPDRNPELTRDVPDRKGAADFSSRLSELPRSHPSSADYGSDHRQPRAYHEWADYDSADDIRVSDRRTHILDGDETGGGHRHGTDRPGKTEFPVDWSDDRILDAVASVARNPDEAPQRQNWNDRWQVSGERDGVKVFAVLESDGRVWTAWPDEGSPGVVKNAVKDN